jgi:hypothetical protein
MRKQQISCETCDLFLGLRLIVLKPMLLRPAFPVLLVENNSSCIYSLQLSADVVVRKVQVREAGILGARKGVVSRAERNQFIGASVVVAGPHTHGAVLDGTGAGEVKVELQQGGSCAAMVGRENCR